MKKSAKELWAAAAAVAIISAIYLSVIYQTGSIPAARGFFGHSLGVIGFTLMIMTELFYTWRKRSRSSRWGKMASWLRFHIFTGIVGPYMVLLHSAWEFNGLAGIVMLLTFIIVLSGFLGRYIYTAIPRTVDGSEIGDTDIQQTLHRIDEYVDNLVSAYPQGKRLVTAFAEVRGGWVQRARWNSQTRNIRIPKENLTQLYLALTRKNTLRRQVKSLTRTRQMLGLWHIIHIPLGLALFVTAILHIAGAIYFATLLR